MDHIESANSPTSALHELELAQIYEGKCDEICSAHVFLAHMPGEIKCHQDMSRPAAAANDQLQVFWYPDSIPNRIQRKIKAFLLSLPESGYVGIFNLVQYWAPTGGGLTRQSLSVSKEPFGVSRICNGVCRYRYFSAMNGDRVDESDPVGRAFLHHLPEFVVNVVEDYSQQRSYAKDCGFQSSWVIPLVRVDAMLFPVCIGVLEFVTRGDIRFDSTLMDKILELSKHVILALNSPSEIETEHHMVPYVQNYQTYDHNSNLAQHFETQVTQHEAREAFSSDPDAHRNFVPYHQTPDDGFSPFPSHIYPQHGALTSSSKTDHILVGANEEQPLQVPTKQNMRIKNAARYEISGSIIEELGSLVSAHDDDNIQDTAQTSMGTRTDGIGKPKISEAKIVEQFGKNIEDAADALGVSKSTLKRNCRHYHIQRWPSHKRNKVHPMSVKATCGASIVKFNINSSIEIDVLRGELGRRFGLDVGSFRIEYEDGDSGERIMLPCTEDLNDHISTLKSSKEKTMHLLVSPST